MLFNSCSDWFYRKEFADMNSAIILIGIVCYGELIHGASLNYNDGHSDNVVFMSQPVSDGPVCDTVVKNYR